MSFTDPGAAWETKRPLLDGQGGQVPDRSYLRMENSSQGIPQLSKLEIPPGADGINRFPSNNLGRTCQISDARRPDPEPNRAEAC